MSRRAPLIVGLVALAAILLVFFLLVFPKVREVGEAREELEAAQGEEITLQAELARLESIREDAPRIRRQLARFRRQVPPVADLPGLINQLQDAADRSNVDFFSVAPQVPTITPEGTTAQIPATIQVIGGFFSVDEFLFRLENLPRAAKVTNVSITEGPDGAPQIQVSLTVLFYTTDTNAGPGAPAPEVPGEEPEETEGTEEQPEATPTPEIPGTTPSPVEE